MSTPDEAAQAAVQAQLAAQAAAVTGTPSAGVYGDPAGAAAPPAPLDLSAARPTVVDVEALAAQLQALQDKVQAAEAAANPPPPPPDYSLKADPGAPGWLHDVIGRIEARLAKLEGE